jgi:hypothetical protein
MLNNEQQIKKLNLLIDLVKQAMKDKNIKKVRDLNKLYVESFSSMNVFVSKEENLINTYHEGICDWCDKMFLEIAEYPDKFRCVDGNTVELLQNLERIKRDINGLCSKSNVPLTNYSKNYEIDFGEELNKKRMTKNKTQEVFNSVIQSNLDSIERILRSRFKLSTERKDGFDELTIIEYTNNSHTQEIRKDILRYSDVRYRVGDLAESTKELLIQFVFKFISLDNEHILKK